MGVTRAGLAVVTLALLVGAQHIDEEELQSLDSSLAKNDFPDDDAELINVTRKVIPTQETMLKEFEDHAEVKLQTTNSPAIQEGTMTSPVKETTEGAEQETASEVAETLPTPLPKKTKGTIAEAIIESHLSDLPLNDKNSDVLNEETSKKSSVVPKKGVEYEKSSVVPKKGADPTSLTPSVVARKGVGAGEQQSSVSAQKEADPKKIEESKGKTTAYFDKKEMNKNTNHLSVLQPVVPTIVQRNNTQMSTNTTNLLSNYSSLPAVTADNPDNHSTQTTLLYKAAHFKPTAATDDVAGSESDGWSYGGAVLGATVLIALVVALVIGYRKVQDFKMRRQYARVDYLIEGMYDV